MLNILTVSRYDEVEKECDRISPITNSQIEVLMDSAAYYDKKYTGDLDSITDLYNPEQESPFRDHPQPVGSPVKSAHRNQDTPVKSANTDSHKKALHQSPLSSVEKRGLKTKQLRLETKELNGDQSDENCESVIDPSNQMDKQSMSPSEGITPVTNKPDNEWLKFKPMEITESSLDSEGLEKDRSKSLEWELERSLFVPRFESGSNNYKLYFGPTNMYMFLVYFYSIYERVVKAYELVDSKIQQDFHDDFSKQGWASKYGNRRQLLVEERFQYFIKAVYTTMCFSNSLDTNKYEDLSRELLGNEAYLLFQMDKIVNNCAKHLTQFNLDASCTISKKLFLRFEALEDKHESQYLANFYYASSQNSESTSNSTVGTKSSKMAAGGAAL
jgi:histone deacetylase complex regulatory component SIN3